MPEYIERSALLRALSKEVGYNDDGDQEINSDTVFIAIESAPAADVAPAMHGRWIPFHSEAAGDIQYCSRCEIGSPDKTDYCQHCGACMIGGEDDGKTD